MNYEAKIGIIDSKIGGLHFLKHLQNEFKNEDFYILMLNILPRLKNEIL